jgi:hypothetical protein
MGSLCASGLPFFLIPLSCAVLSWGKIRGMICKRKILLTSLLVFLAACSSPVSQAAIPDITNPPTRIVQAVSPSPTQAQPTTIPSNTPTPEIQAQLTVVPTLSEALLLPSPTLTLGPDDWQKLPVIPDSVSQRMREVYTRGLASGNNPQAFSKLGDCGSTPAWFLGDFDRGPRFYDLGGYPELQEVIDEFQGSFDRTSVAAKSGMTTAAMFVPLWTAAKECTASEFPVACELRLHRPSFAFVMLGTNDIWRPERFEPQMRRLIEYFLEQGVVPILSTKADNLEGDGSLNAILANLALEYEIPLWNYWRAVQGLPDNGLQEDGAHLTFGRNFFSDPNYLKTGWTQRNLTALQVLDVVWRGVTQTEANDE